MLRAFQPPEYDPPSGTQFTDLHSLVKENPNRVIAVFPECTTTNGRGILPFSPSLLSAPRESKIFPISLRYTPADITTPLPGAFVSFLWNLNSKPTHCIRVRIAESVHNTSQQPLQKALNGSGFTYDDSTSSTDTLLESEETEDANAVEKGTLDRVAEALARLGRSKRIGLGVKDKIGFIGAWSRQHRW